MEGSGRDALAKGGAKCIMKQGVKEQDLTKRGFSCMDG